MRITVLYIRHFIMPSTSIYYIIHKYLLYESTKYKKDTSQHPGLDGCQALCLQYIHNMLCNHKISKDSVNPGNKGIVSGNFWSSSLLHQWTPGFLVHRLKFFRDCFYRTEKFDCGVNDIAEPARCTHCFPFETIFSHNQNRMQNHFILCNSSLDGKYLWNKNNEGKKIYK